MTLNIKHAFVSGKTDGADTTLIQPSYWNADHSINLATGNLLGNTTGATGSEEISVNATLTLAASVLGIATSVALAGSPTTTTQSSADNSTKLATTAYVKSQAYATLASPTFTGVPLSTTAAVNTSTTQIATTAFVIGQAYAKLASPTFTGVPLAPTAAANTNTTQIASTAYVNTGLATKAPSSGIAQSAVTNLVSNLSGKQASSANLSAVSGLSLVSDRLPYANGTGTLALATFTAAGRALVDDANAAAQLTTLGLDNTQLATIAIVIDGGGSTITTGVKAPITVDFNCTIISATLLADQTGSIVVNLWKDTYANYPPTVADKITASTPPTISSGIKSQNSTLTTWTKTINAGDVLMPNVDSVTTIRKVTVLLKVRKT
jgi:hypothetical protein